MTTKYECDRCEMQQSDVMVVVHIPHVPSRGAYHDVDPTNTFKRDLCDSCHRQLVEFFNRLPKNS